MVARSGTIPQPRAWRRWGVDTWHEISDVFPVHSVCSHFACNINAGLRVECHRIPPDMGLLYNLPEENFRDIQDEI